MRDLRIARHEIPANLVNRDMASTMNRYQFDDWAPVSATVTAYDERHAQDYLRLLDADAQGDDWREVATAIFGVDVAADPARAKAMHSSHLARARWMTEIGYAYLLGAESPPAR
jgi:hypothetical protein